MTKFVKEDPVDIVFISHDGIDKVKIVFFDDSGTKVTEWLLLQTEAIEFGQKLIAVGQEVMEKMRDD